MVERSRDRELSDAALVRNLRVDAVPPAALAVGGISLWAPFVYLKENRVVDGTAVRAADLVDLPLGILLLALVIVVLGAGVALPAGRTRRNITAGAGIVAFWIPIVLLVRSGSLIPDTPAARISLAAGFWGFPFVAYVLLDHARLPSGKGRHLAVGLFLLLPPILLLAGGRGSGLALVKEWSARRSRFPREVVDHIRYFVTATIAATAIGVPLGVAARRSPRLEKSVLAFVDAVQTIPSLALFGLLMGPLSWIARQSPLLRSWGIRGIGAAPALIALTLYALLPVVRNTVTGLAQVSPAALEAGRGLGMTRRQLFWKVRWPLSAPHILTGVRTAAVQAVGNTAVAALIGAGGLGALIFQGLGQAAPDLVILGVFPLIIMAVAVDRLMGLLIHVVVSPGIRPEARR